MAFLAPMIFGLFLPLWMMATGRLKAPENPNKPNPDIPTSSDPNVEAAVFSVRNEALRLGGRLAGELGGTPGSLQQSLYSEERGYLIQQQKALVKKPTLFTGELAQAWPQTSRKVPTL